MILEITREYDKSFSENTYKLGTYMLQMKSTHLFIASNAWEKISLELEDSIPEGYLRSLHLVCNNIKVKLPESTTEKTLHLLTELFPDKAGALRRCYMQGRDLREVLSECLA